MSNAPTLFGLRIPKDMAEKLQILTIKRDTKRSRIIKEAIAQYLEIHQKETSEVA